MTFVYIYSAQHPYLIFLFSSLLRSSLLHSLVPQYIYLVPCSFPRPIPLVSFLPHSGVVLHRPSQNAGGMQQFEWERRIVLPLPRRIEGGRKFDTLVDDSILWSPRQFTENLNQTLELACLKPIIWSLLNTQPNLYPSSAPLERWQEEIRIE